MRGGVLLLTLLTLIACSDSGAVARPSAPEPSAAKAQALVSPPEPLPSVEQFVVVGRSSARIGEDAVIRGGGVAVLQGGEIPGRRLGLLRGAIVDGEHAVFAETLLLGPSSTVGEVYANEVEDLGGSHGTIYPFEALTVEELPVPELPTGDVVLDIAPKQKVTLSPSVHYARVRVGEKAKVRLPEGVTWVDELQMDEKSVLEATGAAELRITKRLTTGSKVRMMPQEDLAGAELRVIALGRDESAEAPSVELGDKNNFSGLLFVPGGTLVVGDGTHGEGKFLALNVFLGTGVTLEQVTEYDLVLPLLPGFDPVLFGCLNPLCVNACRVSTWDFACSQTDPVCVAFGVKTGAACDSGDQCTVGTCSTAGECVAGPVCDPGDPCLGPGTCDPVHGCGEPVPLTGGACQPSDPCMVGGTCSNGVCVGNEPKVCTPSAPCKIARCEAGACVEENKPEGAHCSDSDACTYADKCEANTCVGTPVTDVDKDDGNACTDDACDKEIGVTHTPKDGLNASDGQLWVCDPATGDIKTITPPPLDLTVVSSMNAIAQFLLDPVYALQVGFAADAIRPLDVAVVRGRVLSSSGQPLPGATVAILNEPDYGYTRTRGDGAFDLVVNGGRHFVVSFVAGDGYLPVQRAVMVPAAEFTDIGEVMMIEPDPVFKLIELCSDGAVCDDLPQMAKGSVVVDDDGTRQAVLVVGGKATAVVTHSDGTTDEPAEVRLRMTEYTVGENGTKRMPGTLPPNVGYTYAVELQVLGAQKVEFVNRDASESPPLRLYVDNFIGFPVGTPVPAGYYDRDKGIWIASQSGYVIQIIDDGNGACLDLTGPNTDGDSFCDEQGDVARAAELGLNDDEAMLLLGEYAVGASLWVVPIRHFSAWDCNWGFGPPDDGEDPDDGVPDPTDDDEAEDDCDSTEPGSIIGCRNQSLGEEVPVAGTSYKLAYNSMRVPGYRPEYELSIPLKRSGADLPARLLSVELRIQVAGKVSTESWLRHEVPEGYAFSWDGFDVFHRKLQGAQPITVEIGYTYAGQYRETGRFGTNPSDSIITGDRDLMQLTLWKRWKGNIGAVAAAEYGIGGWTVSEHHLYDPGARELLKGDGTASSAEILGPVVKHLAGGFACRNTFSPQEEIGWSNRIAAGPDGWTYISELYEWFGVARFSIRRIGLDQKIEAVRDWNAQINGLAVAGDGGIYFADRTRVWYVPPGAGAQEAPQEIAGNGSYAASNCGDGLQGALTVSLDIDDLALLPDGRLLVAMDSGGVICAISTPDSASGERHISPFAGTGAQGSTGDGGPAAKATINWPGQLGLGSDGSVYVRQLKESRIRRIDPSGVITTVVGGGTECSGSDWKSCLPGKHPDEVSIELRGFAIMQRTNQMFVSAESMVLRIDEDRKLQRVSSDVRCDETKRPGWCGEGGLAATARITFTNGLSETADGRLVIQQQDKCRLWSLEPGFPGASVTDITVPDSTGTEIYVFGSTVDDPPGTARHLRTLNALTGATLREFSYTNGMLSAIVEDGLTTTIAPSAGKVTISAPFGQKTEVSLGANGYVSEISVAGNGKYVAGHLDDGLLGTFTKPDGVASQYIYDDNLGRLVEAKKGTPALTSTLERESILDGYSVTYKTHLERSTVYSVQEVDGKRINTTAFPTGLSSTETLSPDGTSVMKLADGRTVTTTVKPDPRYGMMAPLRTTVTKLPISNLEKSVQRTRAVEYSSTPPNPITSIIDSTITNGKSWTSVFDAAARTTTFTSPALRKVIVTVDAQGRPTEIVDGAGGATLMTYNAGRISSVVRGNRSQFYDYSDETGYLFSIEDPLGYTTQFDRDAMGRATKQTLAGTTLADGRFIGFGYTGTGDLKTITPASKPTHAFLYDAYGRLEFYDAPDPTDPLKLMSTGYTYNNDHQLMSTVAPDDSTIARTYDPTTGRLQTVTLLPAEHGRIEYEYDDDYVSQLSGPSNVVLTIGNDGPLPVQWQWSGDVAGTVAWTHNADFLVSTETVGASSVAYSYLRDDLSYNDGLPTRVGAYTLTGGIITPSGVGLTLGWDTARPILTSTQLKDAAAATTTVDVAYVPNAYGELTSSTVSANNGGATTLLYAVTYEDAEAPRDAKGRVVRKVESIVIPESTAWGRSEHQYAYEYDAQGRLWKAWLNDVLTEYTYDDNGNRLNDGSGMSDATYDAQDRLMTYGELDFTYTAQGSLATKTRNDVSTTTFGYDALGNLRSVQMPNDGPLLEYVVDGMGRRVGKKVNDALEWSLIYRSQLQPVAEIVGTEVTRFVYSGSRNVPDYAVRDEEAYQLVTDQLGSLRLVVSLSDGAIMQRMDYGPFGEVTQDWSAPGWRQLPFGFAGGIYDRDTKLVRFGARDYDAEVGRWVAKDPIGFRAKGQNLYAYVLGDPVNAIDPGGTDVLQDARNAAAVAAAIAAEAAEWVGAFGQAAAGVTAAAVVGICGAVFASDSAIRVPCHFYSSAPQKLTTKCVYKCEDGTVKKIEIKGLRTPCPQLIHK